jgi:hypothetical protein
MDEVREVREVLLGDWHRVKTSKIDRGGWLRYELANGTVGLAQPKSWRIVDRVTGLAVPTCLPDGPGCYDSRCPRCWEDAPTSFSWEKP